MKTGKQLQNLPSGDESELEELPDALWRAVTEAKESHLVPSATSILARDAQTEWTGREAWAELLEEGMLAVCCVTDGDPVTATPFATGVASANGRKGKSCAQQDEQEMDEEEDGIVAMLTRFDDDACFAYLRGHAVSSHERRRRQRQKFLVGVRGALAVSPAFAIGSKSVHMAACADGTSVILFTKDGKRLHYVLRA